MTSTLLPLPERRGEHKQAKQSRRGRHNVRVYTTEDSTDSLTRVSAAHMRLRSLFFCYQVTGSAVWWLFTWVWLQTLRVAAFTLCVLSFYSPYRRQLHLLNNWIRKANTLHPTPQLGYLTVSFLTKQIDPRENKTDLRLGIKRERERLCHDAGRYYYVIVEALQ